MELSIVVPIYNEGGNILALHSRIKRAVGRLGHEIIFVDDGSNDSSSSEIRAVMGKDKSVRLARFGRNRGLSKALEKGFSMARGKTVVSLDGDLQNDPQDIPRLISALRNGFDVVCGYRKHRKDSLFVKVLPSKAFNFMVRSAFKVPVHDCGCTLRAYAGRAVRNLPLADGMHRFLPVLLQKKGFKVGECIVRHNPRSHGLPKFNSPKRFLEAAKCMVYLKRGMGKLSRRP